jgi:hypothetical protein
MRKYVILSLNDNPTYSFYLPLVVWAWRKIGWEPIVFFAGSEIEGSVWLGLKYVDGEIGLHRVEVQHPYESNTIAQVSRLYATCLYGHKDDYLMTSDIDMLPLSDYWQFDPEKITTWGHDLTNYEHYPICYIGMKRTRWVEVMGLTSHQYDKMIKRDLDSMPNAKSMDFEKRWVVDQDLITARIKAVTFEKENVSRGSGSNGYPIGRVDRSAWTLEHPTLIDCHMLRDIYTNPDSLAKTLLLLFKAFPNDDFTWFKEYTEEFSKRYLK